MKCPVCWSVFLVAAATLAVSTGVEAQVCAGFPTENGEPAVAATTSFLTGGSFYGLEFGYDAPGSVAFFAGVGVADSEVPDSASEINYKTSAGVGIAVDAPFLSRIFPPAAAVCPTVAVVFSDEENTQTYSVPVGLGIGTKLPLDVGGDAVLVPYAVPQLNFKLREENEDSEVGFLLSLGALLRYESGFYIGGSVNRIFIEGRESEFGLKAGYVF